VLRALVILLGLAGTAVADRGPCALVVAVDRATQPDTLEVVRTGIAEMADGLRADDQLAVVAFDAKAQVLAPLQSAKSSALAAQLGRLAVAKSSNIIAGLEAARVVARGSSLACRRVIAVTSGTTMLGVRTTALAMHAEGIAVSAVGVQSLNRTTLQTIASAGGGRVYVVEDATGLARVARGEAAIPVKPPRLAVVFLIDRSGSMTGPRLEMAKEAARVGVEILDPNDQLGVIAFDDSTDTLVDLQPVRNRMRISRDISRLQSGGPTDLAVALATAGKSLDGIKQYTRHIVLFTDGDSQPGADQVDAVVATLAARGIVVSAIGVHGTERDALVRIVKKGTGQVLLLDDPSKMVKGMLAMLGREP
jgi:Mg-chelatase subunit ChlD